MTKDKVQVDFGNDGYIVNASIYKDGNQWCVGIGDFPTGVYGFGHTVGEAISDFKDLCRNSRG